MSALYLHLDIINSRSDANFSASLRKVLGKQGVQVSRLPIVRWRTPLVRMSAWRRRAKRSTSLLDFASLLQDAEAGSVVVLTGMTVVDLEILFDWVAKLKLCNPLKFTAYVKFSDHVAFADSGPTTIGARLRSGSPFEMLYFFREATKSARAATQLLDFPIIDLAAFPSVEFYEYITGSRSARLGLSVEKLGPLLIHISALWGRTGSTSIFDSQTRYFLNRGFFVVRILVDHWPDNDYRQPGRTAALFQQQLAFSRAHINVILKRDCSSQHEDCLTGSTGYSAFSPVRRVIEHLSRPLGIDEDIKWIGSRAKFCVVNHVMHTGLSRELTNAPKILETHDIYSDLMDIHGIPWFASKGPDDKQARLCEEIQEWKSVAACVNLSKEDNDYISQFTSASFLIPPYIDAPIASSREWGQVLKENGLEGILSKKMKFDVMLFGDHHNGNVHSIRWFFKNVVDAFPNFTAMNILIAGRICNMLPEEIVARQNVFLAGYVDNLSDFARRSKVVVIPDQAGTGRSIKFMEVCALGLPFSCSEAGMRGVAVDESAFTINRNAASFAADVIRLTGDEAERLRRGHVAREIYDRNFSKRAYEERWTAVVELALSKSKHTCQHDQ